MYTRLENVRIVIALLKEYNIKHLVLSAGQSNYPFVHSVENDPFFTCYSVVDERSAAFFAMGIAQQLNEPVAISCTASTACCNYLSAITEAYYQKIPVLVLTSDRDIRRRGQLETLLIDQDHMYEGVCKKEIVLPDINSDEDRRYCERIVNEALLELDHHGKGPVHINMPSYGKENAVDVEKLPCLKRMYRHNTDKMESWLNKKEKLCQTSKVMLLCGQHETFSEEELKYIDLFHEQYNCVVVAEHMGNLRRPYVINFNPIVTNTTGKALQELAPDIIISFGTHIQDGWERIKEMHPAHWNINQDGAVIDAYSGLTDIFECTLLEFLKFFVECSEDSAHKNDGEFENRWREAGNGIKCPDVPLSHVFAVENMMKKLPERGILHLSIQNSIRLAQYFTIPDGIKCYANLGGLGIDGSMSTFLGQAVATSDPAYLIIGDLSFFYDMNCLKIKHITSNTHIMLLNNGGGAEFYQNNGINDTLDLHTAAKHHSHAKNWAESCGFEYIEIKNKEEFENNINCFMGQHERPILMEVFTDLEIDMNSLKRLYEENLVADPENPIKHCARKVLGPKGVEMAKKVVGVLRR